MPAGFHGSAEFMADLDTKLRQPSRLPATSSLAARDAILEFKARIGKSVLGQDHLVESMLIGLLANGNLLIESLPGLAKTRAVKTLAKTSPPICRASSSRPTCCRRT